jgi:DNA-binding transcriptional MocR family regulator
MTDRTKTDRSKTAPLTQLSPAELASLEAQLRSEYDLLKGNKLNLNLSRGKPAADQLALSNDLDKAINGNYHAADGTDTRNYGELRGLPEARELGAELLGVPSESVIAGGNSSLALMHLTVSTALNTGLWGDDRNWHKSAAPKLLAPAPGYDRHFALSEALGVELINVGMTGTGPDMQQVKALAAADADIKGIWCVPKYSNPTGCIYDAATVEALAELPHSAAADDFVVLYDNAYAVHDLVFPAPPLESIHAAAVKNNTQDHVVQFASTSKITFAGAGVAFVSSGNAVLRSLEEQMSVMTIGPDKINQLRHVRFLQGRLGAHMQAHAQLLRPKFELVARTLTEELGGLDVASWNDPKGGYFVSLDLLPGLAAKVVLLAQEIGLKLTPAGATFPYGRDPEDRNVRIAPTFADIEELGVAMQILTLCVKLASVRKLLDQ